MIFTHVGSPNEHMRSRIASSRGERKTDDDEPTVDIWVVLVVLLFAIAVLIVTFELWIGH